MNPNLFPFNNMTRAELVAEAERTDNKLALAILECWDNTAPPEAEDDEEKSEMESRIERAISVLEGYG